MEIKTNGYDTDRKREALKQYAEVWNGINDSIKETNNSELGEYDKDYMKINSTKIMIFL